MLHHTQRTGADKAGREQVAVLSYGAVGVYLRCKEHCFAVIRRWCVCAAERTARNIGLLVIRRRCWCVCAASGGQENSNTVLSSGAVGVCASQTRWNPKVFGRCVRKIEDVHAIYEYCCCSAPGPRYGVMNVSPVKKRCQTEQKIH